MKKKKTKINVHSKFTLKEYHERFDPLHDEISKRVEDIIEDVISKHLDCCPSCDEAEYPLAHNVVSKALCSIASRLMITSRTFINRPVDFSTTVQLKKNFESCLQQEINHYNDWYKEEVLNKNKRLN